MFFVRFEKYIPKVKSRYNASDVYLNGISVENHAAVHAIFYSIYNTFQNEIMEDVSLSRAFEEII